MTMLVLIDVQNIKRRYLQWGFGFWNTKVLELTVKLWHHVQHSAFQSSTLYKVKNCSQCYFGPFRKKTLNKLTARESCNQRAGYSPWGSERRPGQITQRNNFLLNPSERPRISFILMFISKKHCIILHTNSQGWFDLISVCYLLLCKHKGKNVKKIPSKTDFLLERIFQISQGANNLFVLYLQ